MVALFHWLRLQQPQPVFVRPWRPSVVMLSYPLSQVCVSPCVVALRVLLSLEQFEQPAASQRPVSVSCMFNSNVNESKRAERNG